ncbi:hypothetical protein AB0M43_07340 [Longispora sp. NPDC051575]|uniref:hypothetical protein n=1 Tax=Longispora sp. NPDC051575 TaxID=3154943 RepID=UPI003442E098
MNAQVGVRVRSRRWLVVCASALTVALAAVVWHGWAGPGDFSVFEGQGEARAKPTACVSPARWFVYPEDSGVPARCSKATGRAVLTAPPGQLPTEAQVRDLYKVPVLASWTSDSGLPEVSVDVPALRGMMILMACLGGGSMTVQVGTRSASVTSRSSVAQSCDGLLLPVSRDSGPTEVIDGTQVHAAGTVRLVPSLAGPAGPAEIFVLDCFRTPLPLGTLNPGVFEAWEARPLCE